jgi:hypothetical protein
MPIRFRCQYCQQLLGIARRKAGSLVRCPTCQRDVEVPPVQEPNATEQPGLFERDDFDDLLQAGSPGESARSKAIVVQTPVPAARPQAVPPPPAAANWQLAPVQVDAAPVTGVLLSPARATVLTVIVILLLALAFATGLIIGRYAL